MDMLISFPLRRFYPMRREALRILKRLGDQQARITWTPVDGIAVAHTSLDNREVIQQCRELLRNGEVKFEFAVKWLPIDYWCETDLEAIKQVIEEQILPLIQATDSWAMIVKKRRWQYYHTSEIIAHLAPSIDRKVDLNHPDKIVWIDVLGAQTAIALLKPAEIFSIILEY